MDYGKKIQIHNFVVLKYKVDKTSFIKVSTVTGDWSVLYREDSIMYLTLDMADESQYEGIYNVMVGMYGACNTVDQEFTKELFDALNRFYERLKAKGFVIYPGKISHADTFRIGNIGDVFPEDMEALIRAIKEIR